MSAPTIDRVLAVGHDVSLRRLNNWDGTSAPTSADDVLLGYSVGSRWVDAVGGRMYVCVVDTAGQAEWVQFDSTRSTPVHVSSSAAAKVALYERFQ